MKTLKTIQDRQKAKANIDKLAAKKAVSAVPKNNSSVFSVRPEPNRGPGADRHPNVPRAKVTSPTSEEVAVNSIGGGGVSTLTNPSDNYSSQMAQKKKLLKTIKTDMIRRKAKPVSETKDNEYSANKELALEPEKKKPSNNDYFSYNEKKTQKKPVKNEEFAAGIGNTQAPANSKKTDKKSLKAIKSRHGTKSAVTPSTTSNNIDVGPAIGGA